VFAVGASLLAMGIIATETEVGAAAAKQRVFETCLAGTTAPTEPGSILPTPPDLDRQQAGSHRQGHGREAIGYLDKARWKPGRCHSARQKLGFECPVLLGHSVGGTPPLRETG